MFIFHIGNENAKLMIPYITRVIYQTYSHNFKNELYPNVFCDDIQRLRYNLAVRH